MVDILKYVRLGCCNCNMMLLVALPIDTTFEGKILLCPKCLQDAKDKGVLDESEISMY